MNYIYKRILLNVILIIFTFDKPLERVFFVDLNRNKIFNRIDSLFLLSFSGEKLNKKNTHLFC